MRIKTAITADLHAGLFNLISDEAGKKKKSRNSAGNGRARIGGSDAGTNLVDGFRRKGFGLKCFQL